MPYAVKAMGRKPVVPFRRCDHHQVLDPSLDVEQNEVIQFCDIQKSQLLMEMTLSLASNILHKDKHSVASSCLLVTNTELSLPDSIVPSAVIN